MSTDPSLPSQPHGSPPALGIGIVGGGQLALMLAEAARVVKAGGRIAIIDFAAHELEELRSRHAHARLGFSDEQMLLLLSDAGFAPGPAVAVPGGPLTVKIWTAARQSGTAPATNLPTQARAAST